jgi:pullulanase/glycogen debranching enzyme
MESSLSPATRDEPVESPVFTISAGRAWPIGAHADDSGVNFAVFSANAQAIDLCVFDAAGTGG